MKFVVVIVFFVTLFVSSIKSSTSDNVVVTAGAGDDDVKFSSLKTKCDEQKASLVQRIEELSPLVYRYDELSLDKKKLEETMERVRLLQSDYEKYQENSSKLLKLAILEETSPSTSAHADSFELYSNVNSLKTFLSRYDLEKSPSFRQSQKNKKISKMMKNYYYQH